MGLIDKVASRLGYLKARDIGPIIGSYFTAPSSSGVAPEKEYGQLVEGYKSWVYTCIDKIAKSVAMIPLGLYVYRDIKTGKKNSSLEWRAEYKRLPSKHEQKYLLKDLGLKKEQIFEHPFLALINHPNSFMTRFMLWYETMIRLELGGLCGWLMIRNGLNIPKEIWPLPLTKNARLRPKISPKLELQYWEYRDGDVNQQFKPEEILLIKYPHPASPFQPMSPLMAQTYPYDIDLFLMQQQRAFFDNMAVPGLHLSTEQRLTAEMVKELKDMMDEQYSSALKAGKTLITHSGLKADKTGATSRESMIDKVAQFAREKLITAYDLSEGKLGLVRDVNRANMEALNETFYGECLRPKCMMIEEIIETFMLPMYDTGLTCDFELPEFRQKDVELQERRENLMNMFTTINEEREKEGKDSVPWGDRPWTSFTMTQVGDQPNKLPPEKVIKGMTRDFWTEEKKEIAWKMFVSRSEDYEQALVGPIRNYFGIQRDEVIKRLNESGKRILGQYSGWSRTKIDSHLPLNKAVDGINIDKKIEVERLRGMMAPLVKAIMKEAGGERFTELFETVKVRVDFNVNDPRVLKWLGRRMREFSEEVTGTTFREIEQILKVGFSEGLPLTTISETLIEKFESWDKYRAPLIARTETIAAMNEADIEAVHQTGLEDKLLKHWLTAMDEAVRDTHRKAGMDYEDGIPVDEDFEVGDDRMEAPGNGKVAGENINCRCTLYYTEKE